MKAKEVIYIIVGLFLFALIVTSIAGLVKDDPILTAAERDNAIREERIAKGIKHFRGLMSIPEGEKDSCLRWAFGEDYEQLKLSSYDDRWRSLHSDLQPFTGADSIEYAANIVSAEWNSSWACTNCTALFKTQTDLYEHLPCEPGFIGESVDVNSILIRDCYAIEPNEPKLYYTNFEDGDDYLGDQIDEFAQQSLSIADRYIEHLKGDIFILKSLESIESRLKDLEERPYLRVCNANENGIRWWDSSIEGQYLTIEEGKKE